MMDDGRLRAPEVALEGSGSMPYKFERLEVWSLALEYVELAYQVADALPRKEDYNLKSQLVRAATSVALNIAEGSTSQTDIENSRFVGMAIRSLIETIACMRVVARLGYPVAEPLNRGVERVGDELFAKLQSLRRTLDPERRWVRESEEAGVEAP